MRRSNLHSHTLYVLRRLLLRRASSQGRQWLDEGIQFDSVLLQPMRLLCVDQEVPVLDHKPFEWFGLSEPHQCDKP